MNKKLTDAEITHLRQLLAWMRCEYCLDEDMQRGALGAVKSLMNAGYINDHQAQQLLANRAELINKVPKYVRQSVKMLTKKVREIDGVKGEILSVSMRDVEELE